MYLSPITILAFTLAIITTHACDPGTDGCDHPGNFAGTLTSFQSPQTAHCSSGNQSFVYASIPASFYNPPDESPCDAPINITNPSTKKTIQAIVIGECKTCKGNDIQLTTAGLAALSPNRKANRAPKKVKWTFDEGIVSPGGEKR